MSSYEATRCRHIKVNGTQCGSPALRNKKFCFYHQEYRPWKVECYSNIPEATGEIALPYFEDAHSVQLVIRQVVQMVLQKRIEQKTASILLYALQIASSNLKRMELEKPQPEQVVVSVESDKYETIAALEEPAREQSETDLPPGTIHACVSTEVGSRVAGQQRRKNASRGSSLFMANTRSFDSMAHSLRE
jgi:hypothetical protein